MLKKIYYIVFIILSFIGFYTHLINTQSVYNVLDVISADKIAIDLNRNDKLDENEILKISQYDTLNTELREEINYLGIEFARTYLESQKVRLKKNNEGYYDLYVNNINYTEKFNNSGFAYKNDKPVNLYENEKIQKEAKTLNLHILNLRSMKYHKPSCEYGKASHNKVFIPYKRLPKTALACKYCKPNLPQNNYTQNLPNQNHITTNEVDITLFLTDLINKFKPDNTCSTQLCQAILYEINNSTKSIDIALYGYSNIPQITSALANAQKRGVKIRYIFDSDHTGQNIYPNTYKLIDFATKHSSDTPKYVCGISKTASKALMHNKFIIFDDMKLFTGSSNISTTDMSGFNSNSSVLVNNSTLAKIYKQEFEQMLNGRFHNQKSKIHKNKIKLSDDINITPYFSPKDNIIDSAILPLINRANNYIYIPTFLITSLKITEALIEAKKIGIDIKILIDATNANEQYSKHEILRKNGIQVKTENFAGKMHSKSMIIDDKYIIIGSMNFSNSGNSKNDENLLVIESEKLAKEYKKFFLYQWSQVPEKWLYQNAQSESKDSIGACFDGLDNDYDGKIDSNDIGCR